MIIKSAPQGRSGRAARVLFLACGLLVVAGSLARAAEDIKAAPRASATPAATPATTPTPGAQKAPAQPAVIEGLEEAAAGLTPGMRVGVIDLERVARDSRYFQRLVGKLEADVRSLAEDVDLKVQQMRSLEEQLNRQRTLLAPDEIAKQETELQSRRDEVDLLNVKARRMAQTTQDSIIEPALLEVLELTRSLAQRGGFDVVLRADLVLFVSKHSDLTDEVIAALDSRLPPADDVAKTPDMDADVGTSETTKATPKPAQPKPVASGAGATPAPPRKSR